MKRSEFLKVCSVLGIGVPFLSSCSSNKVEAILKPGEKVVIVGAGAAGMSAAYLLKRRGVDITVLEASNTYGGRIESDKDFADFTIPLGAE
ncbi:MAG: FAD-dependent oxidoreductase [Cyanothece sp. SIO1E1]|nr:FAD-dependent oxidoreductase [Cyanothece sp. SIO1E1]